MNDDELRDAAIEFLFHSAPQLLTDEQFVEAFVHYTHYLWYTFKEDAAEAVCVILAEQREVWCERLRPSDN